MNDLLIGIDIGGTKTQISASDTGGKLLFNRTYATRRWRGETFSHKAALLGGMLKDVLLDIAQSDETALRSVAVGAHGCDLARECRELEHLLAPYFPKAAWHVVSDVALVTLAAGKPRTVGVISGTGSVAIALMADGEYGLAGGWG